MSISSEITSMGENLKKDYQSIANLGADLTNVDKNIENIAELLDGVYDVLPKTSFQEGTEITLSNTLKGKLDFDNGVVGIGQTEQDSTNGYQLLNIANGTYSSGNVNAVVNNGIITLNGTSGSSVSSIAIPFATTLNGEYILSANNEAIGTSSNWTGMRLKENSSTTISSTQVYFITANASATFTLENKGVQVFELRLGTSVTYTNYVIKPMLETGTTAHDFEPYTGGYVSPSPNWEQEIKYVRGKNRFKGTLYNGIINNSGDYVSNSTRITNSNNGSNSQVYLEKGTYTLSIKDLDYCSVLTKNASGTIVDNYAGTWNTLPFTFNVTSEAYVYISARKSSNVDISPSDYNIMLEEGTQATPYLPYNTIEEVVSGKNLVSGVEHGKYSDVTGNKLDDNTLYRNIEPIPIKPNTTYTFSINGTAQGINKFFYDSNMNFIEKTNDTDATFTTPNNAYYINIYRGTTLGDTGWQLEQGSTATTYEPYQTPQTYQLSLGDKKLYGLTNTYKDIFVTDRTTKKWYISRDIDEVVLDSTMTWNSPATHQFNVSNISPSMLASDDGSTSKCNYFTSIVSTASDSEFRNYIANNNLDNVYDIHMNGSGIRFWATKFSTLEQFTTWLDGVNLKVLVVRPDRLTEITGTLAEQLEAWWNAHSLNGTTIITSNGNLPMIIKCRGLKGES